MDGCLAQGRGFRGLGVRSLAAGQSEGTESLVRRQASFFLSSPLLSIFPLLLSHSFAACAIHAHSHPPNRRNDPSSHSYDWTLINDRLSSLLTAREDNDLQSLIELVRSGLVRNLGNITAPKLYNRSFAGTKYLIEEYIPQVAGAVEDIVAESVSPSHERYNHVFTLSTQHKLDFLHDARQAFGRTTLVLQGGAIFGLCHVGVVKALFLQGLLPRIITGTATGALIASLVAIHTEDELPGVLKGDGIDLSAFEAHEQQVHNKQRWMPLGNSGWKTLIRRIMRFWHEGYFLDVKVLEECVKANLGNLTFEEAFHRSRRVLNITVATAAHDGIPTLLNYITAPNVVSCSVAALLAWGHGRRLVLLTGDTANLDGSRCIECFYPLALRKRADYCALQRCQRQYCAMGAG